MNRAEALRSCAQLARRADRRSNVVSASPHDALFRKTFSNPQHAAAELRAVLPDALLAKLDLSTLQLASGSYVDAELAPTQSDLLLKAENGKDALLSIFRYLSLVVDDLRPQTLLATLAAAPDEAKDPIMTTPAARWMAEGEAKGREEGREEAARLILLELLAAKFGQLSPVQRATVERGDEAQLLSWSRRVLSAPSIASVLA